MWEGEGLHRLVQRKTCVFNSISKGVVVSNTVPYSWMKDQEGEKSGKGGNLMDTDRVPFRSYTTRGRGRNRSFTLRRKVRDEKKGLRISRLRLTRRHAIKTKSFYYREGRTVK